MFIDNDSYPSFTYDNNYSKGSRWSFIVGCFRLQCEDGRNTRGKQMMKVKER